MTPYIEWAIAGGVGLFIGFFIAALAFNSKKNQLKINDIVAPLRDELERLKSANDQQFQGVRTELNNNLHGFQDANLKAFGVLSDGIAKQVGDFSGRLDTSTQKQADVIKEQKTEMFDSFQRFTGNVNETLNSISEHQKERLENVGQSLNSLSEKQGKAQDALKETVERRLDALRTENTAKLEEMRLTVDEKLQETLDKRLGESFKRVSEQLEQVFKSMGEMQTLASGVGDLKRVLTNVKTRGALGERFVHDLLEQMMASNQYGVNVEIVPGSGQRVEFAIRMPWGNGSDDQPVWLPLDSKFPSEDYKRLVEASEKGDAEQVESFSKLIETNVRNSAKDIYDKYVNPPHSTDYAILFLATEGLFAEVVRRQGLIEMLHREFHVSVAGPTTLMALVNSFSMGFRTLAIQKKSSEVWVLLGAIKSEFGKYADIIGRIQKKLDEAQKLIVTEVGKRHRAIDRKLRDVEKLPETEAAQLLGVATSSEVDQDDDILLETTEKKENAA